MSEQLTEYQTRLQRLEQLKEAGVIPYANSYNKQQDIQTLREIGEGGFVSDGELLLKNGSTAKYSTAGRMMSFRTMGKISFAELRDSTGDIQIAFVKGFCNFFTGKETLSELSIAGRDMNVYKFAEKFLDIGDFVGVKGELFVTKHGELTLFVDEYQLLSKAIRPLGNKRHGIQDQEKMYRQRYLDMTMNDESYERFLFKSKFYDAMRGYYKKNGFHEIETSILGNAASGAAAKPFVTHHHDYDLDVYLRIAFEPALKMATVGRYERVFEIGKDFRNEGSDPSHIQEFTQIEHYAAYWNYKDNMKYTEGLFDHLFDELNLEKKRPIKDKDGNTKQIDRSTPWERIDYIEGVKKASGGIDISQYQNTEEDSKRLIEDIKEKGHSREGMDTQGVTTLIDYLYKKVLRPNITGPAFVYNYPKTMQPLARQSDENENIVEQYQVVVNGWEIIKAYSELVDPTRQNENFEEQAEAAARGDEEATSADADFLLAMEHGMPPQSGFGMGLERILSLLTGQDNIRDVVMFPLMKPETHQDIAMGKSKKTKIAVALINQGADMEMRQELNTIAHLTAAFGAREGKSLFLQDEIVTNDAHHIKLNIQHAIMIKSAPSSEELVDLTHHAKEQGIHIAEFTREMLQSSDDIKIQQLIAEKKHKEVEYLGLLLFGEKSVVEKLTKMYTLYKGCTSPGEKLLEEDFSLFVEFPSAKSVERIVEKYLTETKRHCLQVGVIMKAFAEKLGKTPEEQHVRFTTGLLHDIDRDVIEKNGEQHLEGKFLEIMNELQAPQSLIDDIRSHYVEKNFVPVDSEIRKYLAAIDELSGFLYAYSLMRPEGFVGMKRKSINKKLKDKAFASGVNREHVRYCEEFLYIPLQEFSLEVAGILSTL